MVKQKTVSAVENSSETRKRFGEFLVERGLLSPEAVEDALAIQSAIHHRLGILALIQEIISISQIFEILHKQRLTGKPFGEIARQMNLIDEKRLQQLLQQQEQLRMKLGQILVGLLYLTKEEMEKALAQFLEETK